jgi:hypothetical protein
MKIAELPVRRIQLLETNTDELTYDQRYYIDNKEKRLANTKQWMKKNRLKWNAYIRKYRKLKRISQHQS